MPDRRDRRRGILAIAGLLLIALTGCATIPSSGRVQTGVTAPDTGVEPDIDILADGPKPNATIDEILRGFIDAASSPKDDYATARQFLDPTFRQEWNPNIGVIVDNATTRSIVTVDDTKRSLTVTATAIVNEFGEYSEGEVKPVPLEYSFEQVDGQWRIGKAPDGTVIDQSAFRTVFRAHPVYFFDPGFSFLVPDLRWFPSRASTATRIVQALLEGPADWLAPGVVTAFPPGTALAPSSAVPIDGPEVVVDLDSEITQADTLTRQRMKLQLTESLSSGLNIRSVVISADQNRLDIADLGAEVVRNPRIDTRSLILRDDEFGFLPATGETLSPIEGISDKVVALAARGATLSADQRVAAVLTDGTPTAQAGVYRVQAAAAPQLVDSRESLIVPAVDDYGYLWSVPADRPGEVTIVDADGAATPLTTSWPEASSIVSLDVSRDGTRVAALLTVGGAAKFVVASIVRGNADVPVSLGPPLDLIVGPGIPVDAVWVDDLTVASLTAQPDGDDHVVAQQIGGTSTLLGASSGAAALVGANSVRELKLLTGEQVLETQRGVGWQQRIDGVGFAAVQMGLPG
ncbi:GerMN domain-containing protein [Compostimonas suwonensis]|uniref:Sporulation and spore germination protein n=1 Tax=Compostimonas suwonensis TaxID=1048394 RepID=A0A2M9BUQ5_9MICO|nr:GerMN domain-containing protein [Compostimonas suwonensis]PJJ61684.1 sporulation and spore germination protein [Compostimonas suwonensis]